MKKYDVAELAAKFMGLYFVFEGIFLIINFVSIPFLKEITIGNYMYFVVQNILLIIMNLTIGFLLIKKSHLFLSFLSISKEEEEFEIEKGVKKEWEFFAIAIFALYLGFDSLRNLSLGIYLLINEILMTKSFSAIHLNHSSYLRNLIPGIVELLGAMFLFFGRKEVINFWNKIRNFGPKIADEGNETIEKEKDENS